MLKSVGSCISQINLCDFISDSPAKSNMKSISFGATQQFDGNVTDETGSEARWQSEAHLLWRKIQTKQF